VLPFGLIDSLVVKVLMCQSINDLFEMILCGFFSLNWDNCQKLTKQRNKWNASTSTKLSFLLCLLHTDRWHIIIIIMMMIQRWLVWQWWWG